MHTEIDTDTELAARVLSELQEESNPYPVTKANYDSQLQDGIQHHANGIHAEQAKAMIAPFKAVLSLLID